MNEPSKAYQDQSRFNVTFIPADLDDAGLTAPEFRVYCHLCRRAGKGIAFAGVRSIADICVLNKDTVTACIESLVSKRMIRVEKAVGAVNHYFIESFELWEGVRNEGTPRRPFKPDRCPLKPDSVSETEGHLLSLKTGQGVRNEGTKGNPSKETLLKETQSRERDELILIFRKSLCYLFGRKDESAWSNDEELYLFDVIKRKDSLSELAEIQAWFQREDPRYRPRKIRGLLSDWTGALDSARSFESRRRANSVAVGGTDRNAGTLNDATPGMYDNHPGFRKSSNIQRS